MVQAVTEKTMASTTGKMQMTAYRTHQASQNGRGLESVSRDTASASLSSLSVARIGDVLKSSSIIVVVSIPTVIADVERGSSGGLFRIGGEPMVIMDLSSSEAGVVDSSVLMRNRKATTTLKFATIKLTDNSTMAAKISFSPPSESR